MTRKVMLETAEVRARRIRKLAAICEQPTWWVIEIWDNFSAHFCVPVVMEIYRRNYILMVNEEGDTSHCNQAYDQSVAREDKKCMRDILGILRSTTKITKGVIDAWCLIIVGLAMLRANEPDNWINSFNRVNLNPLTRVEFPEWCTRIADYLVTGQTVKVSGVQLAFMVYNFCLICASVVVLQILVSNPNRRIRDFTYVLAWHSRRRRILLWIWWIVMAV
jgi:hypothetical protein